MTDSRFFPGYIWVSTDPNCKAGLCMPATSPTEAAERFLARQRTWGNRGKVRVVYTLLSAGAQPERHEIVL